jgi:3',5'-cyclic AMP phosphodiesterase CpdA
MNLTRRALIKSGGALALAGPAVGLTGAEAPMDVKIPFRFGVIADPQFAPIPNTYGVKTRYYSNSVWKLSEAIERFNHEDLEFVITLGDMIDRDWESFQYVLPLYDDLKHEKFFLLGNHDFNVPNEYLRSVARTVGLQSTYYDFSKGAYRFIVLDGNDISLFAPPAGDARRVLAEKRIAELNAAKASNAQDYNGALGTAQFSWLEKTIQEASDAGQKIVLFSHYPVFPPHLTNALDSEQLVKLVCETPNIVAYLNGHNHDGNYGTTGGKHFLTFRGMVETPTDTAYAIVEVFPDRLEVKGFGIQESRTLSFV